MCIDIVEAQRAVDKYCDMYPAFQDTRECKLLRVSIKYAQVVCIRTTGMVCHLYMFSLLCRSSLTSVGNTNIHVLGPNGLSELLEARFEFPFILIGKMTMDFLRGQSWRVLKSWYTGGGPEQGFWWCFADGLNQSLVQGPWRWLVHGHSSHMKIYFCKAKSLPLPFSVITSGTDNCLLHPSEGGEGGYEGGIYF